MFIDLSEPLPTYADRKRFAEEIRKPHENLTATGLIRTLWLKGNDEILNPVVEKFMSSGCHSSLWYRDKMAKSLFFHSSLYHWIDFTTEELILSVRHHIARVLDQVTYQNPFKEIVLSSGKKLIVERQPASPEIFWRDPIAQKTFGELFLSPAAPTQPDAESLLQQIPDWEIILDCERIPRGLQEYF